MFRNKYVVIGLGVAALLMLLNSFRPLWERGRPSKASAQAQVAVATPPPVQIASNAPAPPASRQQAEAALPERSIDLAKVGWTVDGAPRRDPFQFIKPGSTNAPRLYASAPEVLSLAAVWWQSGTILAVINKNVVSEGESIKGFRIEHIGLERVWVNGPNGPEQLVFDPTLSLRGISVKLDSFTGAQTRLDWPYRVVNGTTNDVGVAADWHMLEGTVVQKISTGRYLVSFDSKHPSPVVHKDQNVIVMNVPVNLVDKDPLPSIQCKLVADETYEAVSGAKTTVHAFDFGLPCSPPYDAVETLKIQKAFLLQQHHEANEGRMKLDRQEAESGSASAQYMLGRRYLYGDGVTKDGVAARRWLEKAAVQGNRDAQRALQFTAYQK